MTSGRPAARLESAPGTPAGFDIVAAIPETFRLESGDRLSQREIRGRLHGPPGSPAVVVAGGISSDRFPHRCEGGGPGWWRGVVEVDGPVDPSRMRVLGLDFAPAPAGGPLTLTTGDQARLLALVLDAAGIETIEAFVGASYGGMVALAFAAAFPERIGRLCILCAAHRAHPMATAWRGIQRRLLAFARDAGQPERGIELARELAMTTYRTPEEFARRFASAPPPHAGDAYPVCEYLIARGSGYAARTDIDRWIALSDAMDRHRLRPEAVRAPVTLVAFASDRLVPLEDMRELAGRLPALEAHVELDSLYGHDGFLKETERLGPILSAFLDKRPSPRAPVRSLSDVQQEPSP